MAIFVGGLSILRQPWLIWVVLAAALPFAARFKIGPLTVVDLLVAMALWLWLANGARHRQLRLDFTWLSTAFAAYAMLLLALTLRASTMSEAITEVAKWVEVVIVLLLLRDMCTPDQSRWLVAGLLLGGAMQGVLGLYQFIFQVGPPWFVIFGRFMRASGSLRQPNPYAGYLGLGLPVAVSLTLWAWRDLQQRRWWFMLYGGATAAMGIGLFVSWSRGGWLGAAGGVAVVLLTYSWRVRLIGFAAAAIGALIALLGTLQPAVLPLALTQRLQDIPTLLGVGNLDQILQQPLTDANFALLERVAHWVVALRMWADAPWFGAGPGNYASIYPAVIETDPYLMRWTAPLGHAHNIYLNVLAEGGLIGLGAYLLLWGTIALWLVRMYSQAAEHSWNRAVIVGVIGVIVHLSIHNFFDNLFVHSMYLHTGLWLGVLCLLNLHGEQSRLDRVEKTHARNQASLQAANVRLHT